MNEITTKVKKDKAVESYFTKLAQVEKSGWAVVEVIYKTVKAPNFEEEFESLSKYADLIGLSKSSISRKVKAYERKLLLADQMQTPPALGFTQLTETEKVHSEDLGDFIVLNEITERTSSQDIREMAKEYAEKYNTEDTEDTEITEDTENTEDSNEGVMIINYNDTEYHVTDTNIINSILVLLGGN